MAKKIKKIRRMKCLSCGKWMEPVYDEIAKKYTGYIWHCSCMSDDINVMSG